MKTTHIRQIALSVLTALATASTIDAQDQTMRQYVDYVDTRVGTAPSITATAGRFGRKSEEHGQTIPAVLWPNGMNFWTPQTRDTELKCIAPYYYADTLLQGFRASHWINGGCTQDYGSVTVMPISGELRCTPTDRASRFSHDDEVSRPHYYSVYLPDEGIKAELTGTSRCCIMRYRYDKGGKAHILINPNNDEAEGYIRVDTARNIVYGYNPVYRIYQGKGTSAGFSGHFNVEVNRKISEYGCYIGDETMPDVSHVGKQNNIGAYLTFDVEPGDEIIVKISMSFTGHEGAVLNMQGELPGWDFDEVRDNLALVWNHRLGTIDVQTEKSPDDRDTFGNPLAKFYGALYRTAFLPHELNDIDGMYVPFESGYPILSLRKDQSAVYGDYSMWDTYRALHPLYTLMYPGLSGDMMQSLVDMYTEGGWLPIFPCWNSYTAAMIGDHCIAAIADAYVKGVRNFDIARAYEAMRHNAFDVPSKAEYINGKGRRALDTYMQYGYVPLEDPVQEAYHKQEQVSRTLEYAYDDYALAQIAHLLGHDDDYQALMARSRNYANVINPVTGYADGRHADGTWANDPPFDFSKHITEGAPCHYTFYVPHDPQGLMKLMGGEKNYRSKLDSLFAEGNYWHGNEPCHQIAYMYNYAGQPWKTAREVRHIMNTEYLNCPGGLSGNDDAGQMSAWYVFSALGFYPVCPGTPFYMIGSPTFKQATLHMPGGTDLTIKAPNVSDTNIYVQRVLFNGSPYNRNYLDHNDLVNGGEIIFEMGPTPSYKWGTGRNDRLNQYNTTK